MEKKPPSKTLDERARLWLSPFFDGKTKLQIEEWLEKDPQKLQEAFWTDLQFGTGGMRGLMGIGSARINRYTIQRTTQGLCNWLKNHYPGKPLLRAVVAYDCRNNSQMFATEVASVFAGNGLQVFLFAQLSPTPLLSFAVRELQADCGVMITASHNPAPYNGFKAYDQEGCQFYTPYDLEIIQEVEATSYESIRRTDPGDPSIERLDSDFKEKYLRAIHSQSRIKKKPSSPSLSILYNSLFGAGITLTPQALAYWGFSEVRLVEAQCKPDGDFPSLVNPNPEDPVAMKIGLALLQELQADLLLANDPDSDRLGVALLHKGESHLLTGQEIALLLSDFVLRHKDNRAAPALIKSCVTSNLIHSICKKHGATCFDVAPGFKFIGRLLARWEKKREFNYLLGAEESHGYLTGLHARDKDGVLAACLVAEMALECKEEKKTLLDRLEEIYQEYGYQADRLLSLSQGESFEGHRYMQTFMALLRKNPPQKVAGLQLLCIKDLKDPKQVEEPMVVSDILVWLLEENTQLIFRPSGTEPKIKVYLSVEEQVLKKNLFESRMKMNTRLDSIEKALQRLFVSVSNPS